MMKNFLILFLLVCAAQSHAQPQRPDEQTKSFLANFRSVFTESMKTEKTESLQTFIHDDIRLMVEFQRTMIGKANFTRYQHALLQRFDITKVNMKESEVFDFGRVVIEFGRLDLTLKVGAAGTAYELRAKYITVWERSARGVLMTTMGWNFNHDVPIGSEMRFPDIPVVDVALAPHVPVNNNISFELAALNGLMEEAVRQHDAGMWSRFYTDDAIFYPQRHEACAARDSLDAYLRVHVAEMPVFESLEVRNDRIDHLGTYVIEYASHIAVWRGWGNSGVGLGKDIRIWRREPDGSLKIFRHMGMYD